MSCSRIDRQDSALSALALNPAGSHCDVGLHSVTRCSVPNYSHETHGMTRTSLQKTEKIQTKDLCSYSAYPLLPTEHRIIVKPILGGLHHEYGWFCFCGAQPANFGQGQSRSTPGP